MKRFFGAMLLLLWPMVAAAQFYPEYDSTTVNDFAGLLPEAEEAALVAQLTQLNKDTGVEMTVVTLSRQETFAPNMSMEEFATGLFNNWGVGDKVKNNGIMVLVLHTDRAMRIELGGGYDSSWDRVAQKVIDRSFLPAFKDGDYIGGITTGVTDTIDTIARPAAAGEEAPEGGSPWWLAIFGGLIAGLLVFGRKIKDVFMRLKTCPSCGQRGGVSVTRNITKHATKKTSGSGEKVTTCSKCEYRDTSTYLIGPKSSNSSSRSSFGGGSSSGGGASGKW